jgi:hypothetical protein
MNQYTRGNTTVFYSPSPKLPVSTNVKATSNMNKLHLPFFSCQLCINNTEDTFSIGKMLANDRLLFSRRSATDIVFSHKLDQNLGDEPEIPISPIARLPKQYDHVDIYKIPFKQRLSLVLKAADEDSTNLLKRSAAFELLLKITGDLKIHCFDLRTLFASVNIDSQGFISISSLNEVLDCNLSQVIHLRNLFAVENHVSIECITLVFSQELTATAKVVTDLIRKAKDKKSAGKLSLSQFGQVLERCHRLTTYESKLVLQYFNDNDEGMVDTAALFERLLTARFELINAGTFDYVGLQQSLKHCLSRSTPNIPIFALRSALSQATGMYLTKLTQHALIRTLDVDMSGMSSVGAFFDGIPVKCGVLQKFHQQICLEIQKEYRSKEPGEQDAAIVSDGRREAALDPKSQQEAEGCEKLLINYISHSIWPVHGKGSVDGVILAKAILVAPSSGLTDTEIKGLAAEITVNPVDGLTVNTPVDHIRKWVPIIWELRQSDFVKRLQIVLDSSNLTEFDFQEKQEEAEKKDTLQTSLAQKLMHGMRRDRLIELN